jgi:hypothetical protein
MNRNQYSSIEPVARGFIGALAAVLLLHASCEPIHAQDRRAMLVGINTYSPPEGVEPTVVRKWRDLEGAVNDVETMRSILGSRFGFGEIHVLKESDASREAILSGIEDWLVEPSKPGDIAVFYYAGHGSQVRNTDSREADGLDETIVPADSWSGAADIRDKEIRDAFNALVEKGVHVTLIFDSCHSGSITRGLPSGRSRFMEASPLVVSDPSDPPKPAERGALILSASQDDEVARELVDEFGNPRGAFTWALAKAIESLGPTESTEQVFLRARAILRSSGATQEPVIAGKTERQRQSFLGLEGGASRGATVTVVEVESDGRVLLQGGIATGLRAGATLVRYAADSTIAARLEVREADGLARSYASILQGDELPEPGDVYEIERWVSSASTPLRLFVPGGELAYEEIGAWYNSIRTEAAAKELSWVDDPVDEATDFFVYWSRNGWTMVDAVGNETELGASPTAVDIAAVAAMDAGIAGHAADRTRPAVFVSLPPFTSFSERLQTRIAALDASVQFVDAPTEATYFLAGRRSATGPDSSPGSGDGAIEYAWVLRAATGGSVESPAPERSDWLVATPQRLFAAAVLSRDVNKLNVAWGWLNLESPPDDGTFPYVFGGFENVSDGTRRFAGDTLTVGEQYRLVLETTFADLEKARVAALSNRADKRYLYFFVMDRGGNGYLLYPAVEFGNVENDVVLFSDLSTEIKIPRGDGVLFEVAEPIGIDSFFLVSTAQPIPQPGIFNFEGVRTRGPAAGEQTELSKLFYALGSGTRSAKQPVPTNWSIERITVRSAQPGAQ